MRSELFRIPIEVGGVPLFGFGALLLAWLVFAGLWAWRSWSRPDGKAEFASLAPVFAVVTAAIIVLPRFAPGGLPIRGYGVMLVIAASSGLAMAIHRARSRGLDSDAVLSMAFGMFVLGIAGARLFFVIEYWDVAFAGDTFLEGVKKALLFTEGGLVVYGSLIGGAIAFAWFCFRHRVSALAMADIIAPSLAIGLAIGRIGCLLNGCCYGGTCDRPWAVTFPRMSSADRMSPPYADQAAGGEFHGFRWQQDPRDNRAVVTRVVPGSAAAGAGLATGAEIKTIGGETIASGSTLGDAILGRCLAGLPIELGLASGARVTVPPAPQRQRSLPVHPTQLYSAINAGLLGWFLWLYYPRRRRDGEVAALLLTIYPVGRFLLEIIRTDESAFFGTGLSISQNVSLLLLGLMAPTWAYLLTRPLGPANRLSAAS